MVTSRQVTINASDTDTVEKLKYIFMQALWTTLQHSRS